MAKTPHSQCRGPRFDPWSGNLIPHATTKSSHAATKDPATKTRCSQIKKINSTLRLVYFTICFLYLSKKEERKQNI